MSEEMDRKLRTKLNEAFELVRWTWCLSNDDIYELFITHGFNADKMVTIRTQWGFFEALMAVSEEERLVLMEYAYEHFSPYKKDGEK